jgi:hypothetical protein
MSEKFSSFLRFEAYYPAKPDLNGKIRLSRAIVRRWNEARYTHNFHNSFLSSNCLYFLV